MKQTRTEQAPTLEPSSAGAKVTVACNLPHGLQLRPCRMVASRELVMGGGSRDIKIAEPVGEPILIYGAATEGGKLPLAPIVAGYALTHGVPKDAWDQWIADNRDSAMVRNGCVFAYESPDDTQAEAREREGTLSGLQPFLPDGDPRAPRGISQDDEQRSRHRVAA